jgi:hypothetical protein
MKIRSIATCMHSMKKNLSLCVENVYVQEGDHNPQP